MTNHKTTQHLCKLIIKYRDESITDDEFYQLQSMLCENPEARKYYIEVSINHSLFQGRRELDIERADNTQYRSRAFWKAMAQEEKTAPAIELPKEERNQEPVQKIIRPAREKREISKFQIVTFVASAAAILFIVAFPMIFPHKGYSVEVATLVDQIDVKWSDSDAHMSKLGSRLLNHQESQFLQKGVIKIVFDYGAEVIIEGPAEFELKDPGEMVLYVGRLCAIVPERATGFTVHTPNASLIDIGTEFGIKVDFDGSTVVHMLKGVASLLPGTLGKKGSDLRLTEGQAKKVLQSGKVQDVILKEKMFISRLDSQTDLIWRGEPLDLADLINNGNGFGSGTLGQNIDLESGLVGPHIINGFRETDNSYHQCRELPFIDGVFVPDGSIGPVQVSSEGHLWKDSPDTTGRFGLGIFTGPETTPPFPVHRFVLGGKAYGTPDHPSIATHKNAGVTFDLAAIRSSLPNLQILRFESLCGISQEGILDPENVSDFYVLVDGEKRFKAESINVSSGPFQVSVELHEDDRFLTLVNTEPNSSKKNPDWGFFAKPQLILK